MIFENRQQAGEKLASELLKYRRENPYVLSLPRGGVPVGFEVAKLLQASLSVVAVRKIGLAGNPEYGIGAIAEGGVKILDQKAIESLGINKKEIEKIIQFEEEELKRRVRIYRGNKPLPNLAGKTAILVDDGMATGITAKAAIETVRKLHPQKIVLAAPVCALDTVESLKNLVDEVICFTAPLDFIAVGAWYKTFAQVSDEEVADLLKKAILTSLN